MHPQDNFYRYPHGGLLRVAGPDRIAFLQRQSSNDLRLLAAENALLTVLTSPTARILDVLYVLDGGDALEALTLPRRAARTYAFLKSRIFFMDKVTVTDASADHVQIDVFGPGASHALAELGFASLPGPDQVTSATLGGCPARLLGLNPTIGMGHRLIVPAAAAEPACAALLKAGAQELGEGAYEIRRVEAGLPGAAGELTEDFTPLEAGLRASVSATKGCYTGQEVLARQINYDKITQSLRGLRLEQPAQPGDRLWAEGRLAGRVTSAVVSPRLGPIALAVVRRPHDQPGTALQVGVEVSTSSGSVVTMLPFSE